MALITVILLGLILITLICILLVCVGSLDNLQRHSEETLQLLKERTINIIDGVGHLHNISTDMKYHQRKLREDEMVTAIETLKRIESGLSDMKVLNDTLLSIKKSLDIIIDHPAFTANYKDTNNN